MPVGSVSSSYAETAVAPSNLLEGTGSTEMSQSSMEHMILLCMSLFVLDHLNITLVCAAAAVLA